MESVAPDDAKAAESTTITEGKSRYGHDLPPDVADQELLRALREGRDEAFDQLVRAHGRWMLSLARRLLRSDADARDVVQDAFVSAFRSMRTFRGDARLSTWLRKILVNHAFMKLRSKRRKPEESLDALLPAFLSDGHQANPTPAWAELPDAIVTKRETRDLVRRSIDALPERYRTVLLLRDIEEMDTQEVATLLKVTSNTVKIRLHRARQALKTMLEPHFNGSTDVCVQGLTQR